MNNEVNLLAVVSEKHISITFLYGDVSYRNIFIFEVLKYFQYLWISRFLITSVMH